MEADEDILADLRSDSLGLTQLLNAGLEDIELYEEVTSCNAELQLELKRLAEAFQRLGQENVVLKNKLKVLERVVPHRDESAGYIAQLLAAAQAHASAQASGSAAAGSAGPAASRRGPQSPHPPGGIGPCSGAETASGAPGAAAADVRCGAEAPASPNSWRSSSRAGSLRALSCGGGGDGDVTSGLAGMAGRAGGLAGFGPGGETIGGCGAHAGSGARPCGQAGTPLVVALCPGPDGEVPALTPAAAEELKRMTPAEFQRLWRHICLQMGVLVTSAEVHGPGSPPHVRLERFLERALSYVDKITLMSPACFVQSMYMNVDTGQPERPSNTFWMNCARSLRLTPQQLADVASLAAVHELDVGPALQQRLQLASQLTSSLAAAGTHPASSGDALTALSAVDELAQQLERSVLREHRSHWAIGDFLCSSVLTPLQVAKALTVSYPYIPDGVAMLHAFKQISAEALSTQGAAAGGGTAAAAGSGGKGQRAAGQAAHGSAPRQTPASAVQQPPSLAALLASQLPALAGLLAPTVGQAAGGQCGAATAVGSGAKASAKPAIAGTGGGPPGPPPTQPQAPPAGLQPAQVQALLAGLQAAQALARAGAGVQVGSRTAGAQAGLGSTQPLQQATASAAVAQLQAVAALLGSRGRAPC